MLMNKEEIEKAIRENPNLKDYLDSFIRKKKLDKPIVFYKKLPFDLKKEKYPNVIYPTKGSIFVHVYRTRDMEEPEYYAIEPRLNTEEREKYREISNLILEKAPFKKEAKNDRELRELIKEIINEVTTLEEQGLLSRLFKKKIRLTLQEKSKIEYTLFRDIVGGGYLECFMRDPYIEDIHVIPGKEVHLVHKVFSMIKTNVKIDSKEAPKFTRDMSERIGSPVSTGKPIVDGTLPDGSRVNIIYSDDVSLKGPTMTIRKFSETPISVIQLTKWGTMSAEIAAYLWLCLEYGLNVFVCGETASGKTTTLNAIIPFIPANKKIYTAESTPEIFVPHPVWQQLLTKEGESKVDLFELLKAALRSRPDYVIPGETRGIEGRILFQAMQTGHPCLTTFHAGSIRQVIQRFVGDPINVPKTFMDNLNVVVIQRAIHQRGESIRRCLSVEEIESYNRELDAILSRTVFEWNPVEDKFFFKGDRNSYILEEKIARMAGFKRTSDIYDEHRRRTRIIEKLVEEGVEDYYEVTEFIWDFYRRRKGKI